MFSRFASLAGYALLIVLALAIGVVSLRYATFNPAVAPDELRPNMEAHPPIFVAHTLAAAVALLVGVWQFMPRTRRTAWHRIEGRVYVGACLIGAIAGFYIAFHTTAGPWATAGFAILAVLWFGDDTDGISRRQAGELRRASTMDGAELRADLGRDHAPHHHGRRRGCRRHLL